jgi:3-hydroxyacyl-CoA dehydrogenase
MPVLFERREDYALVTIDNPPVNAIGRAERAGLLDAIGRVAQETDIRGVVITGQGRMFAAGADTREFDADPEPPHLPDVILAMEASSIPWIAALRGAALGGGYEIALGCHLRIAAPETTVGLPEVTLGVVPGAGATQRLPRLVGYMMALSLISEGRVVKAQEALKIGLIDEIVDDPVARAIELIRSGSVIPDGGLSQRPRPSYDEAAKTAAITRAEKRMRGQIAPQRAIELVTASTNTDFAEAVACERTTFIEIRTGSQAKALRHVFFAERAARVPDNLSKVAPRPLKRAGVVGGGTMGAGIAYALVQAGLSVAIVEADEAAVRRAKANVDKLFADARGRGLMDLDKATALAARLSVEQSYDVFRDVDLVVEAAFEDFEVKRDIFTRLDGVVPEGALLATNTSYLDVDQIAAVTRRPADVIGLHFFSPAHIMRLLEIVRGAKTSDVALATGFALAATLRKIPVVSGVCDGFIGNRILARYREAADRVVLQGALPWEVDQAMVAFGYPMGPYEAQDLSGLDIAYANRKRQRATLTDNRAYVAIADRVVEQGRLGKKAGIGWYCYSTDGEEAANASLVDLIEEEARASGVVRRPFTSSDIQHRLLLAMINEAADILKEGIAGSSNDIDLVTVHGYGFPRWRGGLMHYAESLGFQKIASDLEVLAFEEPKVWNVSDGIKALAVRAAHPTQTR